MQDVLRTLDTLDIEYEGDTLNVKALCPMHERITGEPDHNPSWFINTETGQHICFSCGYKGNLVQLVCDVKGFYRTDFNGAASYDYTAGNNWLASNTSASIAELREMLTKLPQYMSPPPRPIAMSEARLAIYVDPPQSALQERNLTAESAEAFSVLWNHNTSTWILPIRDAETNALMGWQEKGTVDRTFKNRPAGVQKSQTLFGYNNMAEDYVIVVESPLDCLRLHSAGYASAVATYGAIMSEAQAKLLKGVGKIIVAFDNPNIDKAGLKASQQMLEFARKYNLNVFFFYYGDSNKKDPGDMTDEEIEQGILSARSSLLGKSAYVYGDAQAVSG